MFLGQYEHTLDAKGRVAVPAKFRSQLEDGAVISKGMGACLSVYTMARWEEKSRELTEGKTTEELRDFERPRLEDDERRLEDERERRDELDGIVDNLLHY